MSVLFALVSSLGAGVARAEEPSQADAWGPAWSMQRVAAFQGPGFGDFDGTSVEDGSLRLTAADGARFATATINGSGHNAYSRAQWVLNLGEGTTYRTEAFFLLPEGFYANQRGAVQLMGWDTWPQANNQMRLGIWNSDKQARLFLKVDGRDTEITNPFSIPEGRWVHLAIEQRLSGSDGWSRVYLDGEPVAEGAGPTATPYPVTRLRYGLVAISDGAQNRPLTVHFGGVVLSTAQ